MLDMEQWAWQPWQARPAERGLPLARHLGAEQIDTAPPPGPLELPIKRQRHTQAYCIHHWYKYDKGSIRVYWKGKWAKLGEVRKSSLVIMSKRTWKIRKPRSKPCIRAEPGAQVQARTWRKRSHDVQSHLKSPVWWAACNPNRTSLTFVQSQWDIEIWTKLKGGRIRVCLSWRTHGGTSPAISFPESPGLLL
jgi:hypothetical protein